MPDKSIRQLHLFGATSQVRTEMWNNKEYLVVPVVALMEGVIHAVNAQTPEFVPFSCLEKAAASWEGLPVMLGHPKKDGKQCSANSPELLSSHGLGVIRNSRVDKATKKMLQEAWIEKTKAKKLHPDMYKDLEENRSVEVSVGAYVVADDKPGRYGEKPYQGSWKEAGGDHLAFLPGGRGACSIEMGCGTHRAAMHLVTAEGFEVISPEMPVYVLSVLEGQSLDARIRAVNEAIQEKWKSNSAVSQLMDYAYPQEIFDNSVIVRYGDKLLAVPYYVAEDGSVTLGEGTEVKQTYVAANSNRKGMTKECAMCKGLGNLGGNPCEECDGEGTIKILAGARHSANDTKMIQQVHDHAMALGATCDRGNYAELSAPCACGGKHKDDLKAATIRHEGGSWALYSADGLRKLAEHATRDSAIEHQSAIQRSLARQVAGR